MITLLLWLVLCVLVGLWAHSRGRNGVGFAVGAFLFSPILAALLVFAIAPEPRS